MRQSPLSLHPKKKKYEIAKIALFLLRRFVEIKKKKKSELCSKASS